MSRADQPSGVIETHEQETLDFEAERDAGSTSWERADPREALIEQWGRYGYLVTLPDGDAHFSALGRRPDGALVGWCKCKGYRYHDGPCAHLCAVRKAAFADVRGADGEIVAIKRVAELEDMIDAEHAAAQQSGEVFDVEEAAASATLDEYLEDLTPTERRAFVAVEVNDVGVREFGRNQGWSSPGTVSNVLRRAREKLGVA